ncbi:unconventional myosin-XVIIIa isoform X3 [Anoplophora glabripennis]|uniref:unconventional myosin-XVIIIa isoform X3 n=1 Tax=Anoplophora glabripennis TaxID=217634 RepID=UPI000873B73F|nr:unconventional myosin-XVIIIa isoform X3 [Anoplophora glabripennis]
MSAKPQKASKSVGKPAIKRVPDTQKRPSAPPRQLPTKPKRDIVVIHKKTDHCYENVEYKKNGNAEEKKSNKLLMVIDNFDKILSEYSDIATNKDAIHTSTPKKEPVQPKKDTKIPKLVKAKTCSIIESKCILKKANSQPLEQKNNCSNSPDGTKLQNKTKSLCNISRSLSCDDASTTTPTTDKAKPLEESPAKVKEMVKRLNSLTESSSSLEGDSPKPPSSTQKKTMSKAMSTLDLSSSKKNLTYSKIPVNTTLRKAYPSIPCDLHSLDLDRGSAPAKKLNGKLAKSVQNLCPKLSVHSSNKNLDQLSLKPSLPRPGAALGRSVQNLSSIVKLSRAPEKDRTIGRSVQNLSKLSKMSVGFPNSNSINKHPEKVNKVAAPNKNAAKVGLSAPKRDFVKTEVKPLSKPSTVKDLSRNFDPYKEKSKTLKPAGKVQTKANHNQSKLLPKEVEKSISVSKTMEKLSKLKAEDVAPENTFVVLKAPKEELVKSVVEKLEVNKECDKTVSNARLVKSDTFKKVATFPKTNEVVISKDATFGVQKRQFEPKFTEKSLKNSKGTYRKPRLDTVKLDLRKTHEFLDVLKASGETLTYYLDPEDFADVKVEKVMNYLKEDSQKKLGETSKKDLDYSSDNSDDSGNISNELELDCDDTNSSSASVKSVDSSESLTTVLDVSLVAQDSGIDLKKDLSLDGSSKIFFRNGVVSQLETQRDERLAGMVVHLQAHCRGYLARRKLAQRKLQDLAVRCIQRNVRKFLAVRDWPWWRLLVRVTPLLNVHRTEEELRLKTDELEAIKIKLEKSEHDRLKLKHENDKLESKLSEMTADLAEEHSTATLAAERLDAEASERVKIERELSEVQHKNKELQQASERLEMELLYARSDLNGISEEDEDADGDGVYKQRYERAVKELEFTKRRLQQQHEDDLEQLVGLKKQLEKKLADAYEEVEEQRQVVGQWKRKVQKMNGETNDLRLLLEEQNARNNLLEKKQRKFDSETQMLQDELKKEKQAKERLAREKEVCVAEKYTIESALADIRLELELKEERLSSLQREFDEITCGGKTEEEVTILRKQKIDCERRLQDQEEELDELAGQVQLLEQAKLRLEMTLESMRKEAKKEAQVRDEELEDVRCNAQKKVKALEAQLENEHEERTLLLREKHELERRLSAAAETERHDRAGDEALLQRLKRDLKRTKALLRDTQTQLDRQKAETPGKTMIRQLRNQLEDMECARAMAVKARQGLETELMETQSLLEDAHRQKQDAEERANVLLREKSDLQSQLEENEEELAEVLKKFKGTVQQMSLDQMALQEQVSLVSELEIEKNQLKEQLAELTSKLESVESMGDASSNLQVRRSELKVKELESKLELEQTTRARLEVQIARLKEAVEKLQNEVAGSRVKEQQGQDQVRKLQRQLREIKEELNKSLAKESEVIIKKKELEKRCESLEAENSTARTDLRLALKRIEDLQSAIQGDLEDSISDNSDSEQDSYSSDESVSTFLANHKLGSPKNEKTSLGNDIRRLSSASRSSTSSNLGKDPSYT